MKDGERITIGVYAANLRSGGALRHLSEILSFHSEHDVIVFGGSNIDCLKELQNIRLVHLDVFDKTSFLRNIWTTFFLKSLLHKYSVDILFDPSGTYTGRFKPFVSMSRNMLILDTKERNRFKFFSSQRWKLNLLYLSQSISFKKANSVIFISDYAVSTCQALGINIKNYSVIRHGVSIDFRKEPKTQQMVSNYSKSNRFKFLYVSPFNVYKHHHVLVKVFAELIDEGLPISLTFVGGEGYKPSFNLAKEEYFRASKTARTYIHFSGNVKLSDMAGVYEQSDGFVYASTCENMPNILIEAMSSGLPILCSSFMPMPEFLDKDSALFFDPTDESSVREGVLQFMALGEERLKMAKLSYSLAEKYSWEKCYQETFAHIHEVFQDFKTIR